MEFNITKINKTDIHLENELSVFEPRDEVAGHVILQTDFDTAVHSMLLILSKKLLIFKW